MFDTDTAPSAQPDLLARIDALEARIADDLAELRAVRRALVDQVPGPVTAPDEAGTPAAPAPQAAFDADRGTTRRKLMGGVVAGAAAVATGVVLGAEPAAATTGAMQYGMGNDAGTAITRLTSTNISSTLNVVNNGYGFGVDAYAANGPALQGIADIGAGVWGRSSPGIGVRGVSETGTAGLFSCTTGTGVAITSDGAQLKLGPASTRSAPTADAIAHAVGEIIRDSNGSLWCCVVAGTPGTWRKLAGTSTAGSLHLLKAPVRIYDSRAGSQPTVGSKTKLVANQARVLDCKVNGSAVAAGVTGVVLTCLLLDTAAGNGNFTVWANGVAKPSANTMVWGGSAGRFSSLALSGVDANAMIQVASSLSTNLAVDVVGFYR